MSAHDVSALVLAAGKGTRMHSDRPKVLMELLETPMLALVYGSLQTVVNRVYTVVGNGAELIRATFPNHSRDCIVQAEQLGTGHALKVAWEALKAQDISHLLVVNGDTPLLRSEVLNVFLDQALDQDADVCFVSTVLDDGGSFGRVLRQADSPDKVMAIVEAKDFDPLRHGKDTGEINTGIYLFNMKTIAPLLPSLQNDNASKEYYITDLVELAANNNLSVSAVEFPADSDLLGVNTPLELIGAEETLKEEILHYWLGQGVMIHEPSSVRISPMATLEPGACVYGPCEIYGESHIETGAVIRSHCWLSDAHISSNAEIRSFCHIEDARVGPECQVGPYARLRPGAVLEEGARVGNFVEIKKATICKGAKASHLSYIGDARVGENANIGAGTITCNYDGKNKFHTEIGKNAFIGSNTALVAPVTVGDGALVGAGSTITHDVPEGNLGIARGRQRNIPRK